MEDDSWDNIDYDKKISEMQQSKKDVETGKQANFVFDDENSCRYFAVKNNTPENKEDRKKFSSNNHSNVEYSPFSHKELMQMRQDTFDKMIYSTYGNWDRFLVTHEQANLSDESLVELLKIDVALLTIPFKNHNSLLLESLSKIKSFWHQLINLLENFFNVNYKNPKYVLLIDVRGFLENVISLICWLSIEGLQSEMEEIYQLLVTTLSKYSDRDYYSLQDFDLNIFDEMSKSIKIYDVSEINFY
jgi:hypothetical protein